MGRIIPPTPPPDRIDYGSKIVTSDKLPLKKSFWEKLLNYLLGW